ncbi:MAG TPA: prepilin peptidase [Chloroflexus aurantiacus]|jgi:leader peptidase (prepilin peptidase)/N-methyltransferase|uniref:Peptidase A24A domain protein n=1 Tax=Chloroflexus aurantiacus (strain ATCC 29366 / DSM 635 / J-10-fl) TaxID=324602 RepID=A9WDZ9_CHLAA|nr:A24 family peptidase [Chloroflexus aurantiacus]ABY35158.1 peptidase A24A domain protein [Chloroflexus aurantiacus J-10-fl]RMG52359.1 MAG: prepilin peptidase [Chloroflexota bacterium]GIV92443.1 MAG: type 4 prepilin peptidase 1 [Chloroflexus sp.]HBW68669.1 prepilin peptidase [Chloroflexus aurantiacus]
MMDLIVVVIGLVLGSLLNVMIIRLPRERRLIGWPRCIRTGQPLRWWQLLPVIGWLLQRGRAADGRPLPVIYPLVEIGSALWLWRLYELYGFGPLFAYLAFVGAVLIVTGVVDWLYRWIYTFVILGGAIIAFIWGSLVGAGWRELLLGGLIGGVGFFFLYLLALILFPAKSAPFGLGDVYLAIFIGAALGLRHLGPALIYGVFMAGLVAAGILIARRFGRQTPEYLPYGAYLCLGVLIYVALGSYRLM